MCSPTAPAPRRASSRWARTCTVAFMPWYGHNFEDAIVLSERLVKDDVYSSIHIQELELHVRDTKRGQEEITREIPNVAEESLVDLDERGIVRIGAHVKPGDILVGKITPKGETELSPEEKLLTAIFGEKAKDVKDSSLKVPPGMEGVVIDVQDLLPHRGPGGREGSRRAHRRSAPPRGRGEGARERRARRRAVRAARRAGRWRSRSRPARSRRRSPPGTKLTREVLRELRLADDRPQDVPRREQEGERAASAKSIEAANDGEGADSRRRRRSASTSILQPDELPPGVIQLVKVYLAEKRKISVGDKMAGRHGNKGIVARIVPEEDMPFLPDGRPVDIVLNPLGVPSRMNVGQILETHLGWAREILGFYAKTPVFQGANEREIGLLLRLAALTWAAQRARAARRRRRRSATRTSARCSRDFKPVARGRRRCDADAHDASDQRPRGRGMSPGDARLVPPRARLPRRGGAGARRARARRAQGRRSRSRSERVRGRIAVHGAARGAQEGAQGSSRSAQRAATPQDTLESHGLPALAGMLGPKSKPTWTRRRGARAARRPHAGRQGAAARRPQRRAVRQSPVTVGEIYMLKLSHLVDDKIHARSIGPYSLVTQQPLAGKAQFGGQRFGEMEVWALEAYGAAHTLQEILTVKSDDVNGRSRGVRGDREGPEPAGAGHSGIVQRAGEGTAGARHPRHAWMPPPRMACSGLPTATARSST